MSDIVPAQPGNGAAKTGERRVRHGLIEDWRDAVGILLLLLVAAFFGALIARFWPESEETPKLATDLTARLDALEARQAPSELSNLKDRLAKLETRLGVAESAITSAATGSALATPAALEAARKETQELATRLTALEAKLATTPDDVKAAQASIAALTSADADLAARLDTYSERIAKLESSDLIEMARRASLASAIANLTRAAQGSSPFKTEFDVVAAMMPDDQELAAIAPIAAKGLPTVGTIVSRFGNLADRAADAEDIANAEGLWGVWMHFAALFSWRPIGESAEISTKGRLARAGVRLEGGDLAAAVKELAPITGPAKEPLRPWLADATQRIKLEAALSKLNARAIDALRGEAWDQSAEPVPQLPAP